MLRRGKHSNPAASAAASDLFGDKPPDPLSTTDGCWCAAVGLFSAIAERHGTAEAIRIFAALGAPTTQQRRKRRDALMFSFYEIARRQGWKPQRAARQLAEFNKTLAPEDRFGPSGSDSEDTMRVQLAEVIRKRTGKAPRTRRRQSKR